MELSGDPGVYSAAKGRLTGMPNLPWCGTLSWEGGGDESFRSGGFVSRLRAERFFEVERGFDVDALVGEKGDFGVDPVGVGEPMWGLKGGSSVLIYS